MSSSLKDWIAAFAGMTLWFLETVHCIKTLQQRLRMGITTVQRLVIITIIFYSLILSLEVMNAWRSRAIKAFLDKCMICYWLSIVFCIALYVSRWFFSESESPLLMMTTELCFSLLSSFFIVVYILFRGVFIFYRLSREGDQHPTCLVFKKFAKKPKIVFSVIVVYLLLLHAGHIFGLWLIIHFK